MNNIKNNKLIWTVLLMWLCFLAPAHAESQKEGIDVQDIVFSHIQDAYTWHITEWNGKEIAISLPVLVKSEERGWDMFLSHHLHHGKVHHNYYIASEGKHAGKVVEKNSRGEEVRPIDLSLTKNVCGLFLSCGILLFVVLRTARWYKKHPNQVPRGFTGLMEMIISYIQDGVIKESVGKDEYKPYSSYLLTVFFFILINNLIGIIPVFPGGANITGNIAVTAVLAGCTFIAVNLFATKEYYGGPHDHPRAHQPDLYHGIDGAVGEFRNDDRIRAVLCVHELRGIVCGVFAGLHIHFAVGKLYRDGENKRVKLDLPGKAEEINVLIRL